MLPCCQLWLEQWGEPLCMGCVESRKAWADYDRKLKRLVELADPAREREMRERMQSDNPHCKGCGKSMISGQNGFHAVCSSLQEAFPYFTAKSKKEK